ncbi:hypothetical protein FALBO_7070 [Fusarium albosuccineum]|uniref:Uncharacterized protein n=1 Tax=Fusarium albosuccineum TaxID=1237068 RepID=A0A8H4LAV4_9HYPO|nr:hypothetical protein FALBO_7070 [Fusarium albosuccineum]
MDNPSSPGSIASSTPTAPTSASKVTYTTAGTPYNPSTSQPLQPPTRRGRSLKWSAGVSTAGLSLLPKSVLATLPFKTGSRSSSLQPCSPLQTNYDQVTSPLNDTDHGCINMSAQVPRLGASATPSPLASLFSEADQDRFTDGEQSDESDDDCDIAMDLLTNMTVKSLQNLASYPNPSQKRAQKALVRGVKPIVNGLKSATRSDEPSTPLNRTAGLQELLQANSDSPTILRPAQSEAVTFGRFQDDGFWNSGDKSAVTQPESFKTFDLAVGGSTSRTCGKFSSGTLASGPGAPQPLTAGPPGQRQYRPSTFESTFKALKTKGSGQEASQEGDDDAIVIARQTLRQAGIDNMEPAPNSPSFKSIRSLNPPPLSAPPVRGMGSARDMHRDINTGRRADASILGSTEDSPHPGSMATTTWTWPPPSAPVCWASSQELQQPRYATGPRIWTANDLEARNEKVNSAWYAGADFLTVTPEDIAFQVQYPKGKSKFGAVGDGRPTKKRDQYRPMEMDDANRMSAAEHARPLLNIAFVNVQKFVEEEWHKKHGEASPAVQAAK